MTTKHYELTYLISPELSEEESKNLHNKLSSLIGEAGGLLEGIKLPLKRKLYYPIKKNREAYLASLNFQLPPGKLADFETKVRAEEKILRYLLLSKKISKKPGKIIPTAAGKKVPQKPKAELKEIEKKIEEILGE